MKLITAALVSAISCYTELAAAATGHVLTLNPSRDQPPSNGRALSPETARLVIAQRAGVEDYHVETALTEEEINAVNDYGVQTPMLSAQTEEEKRTFVLAFVDETVAESLAKKAPSFAVSPAPSAPETKAFFDDLSIQGGDRVHSWGEVEQQLAVGEYIDSITGDNPFILGLPIEEIEMLIESPPKSSVTILLMPATGSESSSWGSYSMPNSASLLHKRQTEKPLSESFEAASKAAEPAPMSTPLTTFADQTSALPGILPACFRSQEECEKETRNCTGHGKCHKKFSNRDAAKGANADCYSCQCSATTEDRGDGKVKTTVWAGPACQKQDVSIAFWLITLFTVGLIFLVSFAVGNLVSMGGEELPSVIGAGVSGPVRK